MKTETNKMGMRHQVGRAGPCAPLLVGRAGPCAPRRPRAWPPYRVIFSLAILLAVPGARAAGFFSETFEGYTVVPPTNVADIGNGWGATGTCVVAGGAGKDNSQGANIGPGASVWNTVNTNVTPNWIWTDLWLNQTNFVTPDTLPLVRTNTAFMVAFATNGCLYAVNPASNGWELCSADATNGPAPVATTGTWARITVFQNYSNHVVQLFLDGSLIRTNWPFINTNLSSYGRFTCEGSADGNALLDNVTVSNALPPGLNSDINGNGMPDGLELTLYGSLNVWTGSTVMATVSNALNGTVTPQGAVTGIRYNGSTNFTLSAGKGYVVGPVWTNGVPATDYTSAAQKSAIFNWSDITTDGTFQAGFSYNGVWYVPGDYGSLTAAVAIAQANETIVLGNGIGSETVTVASNLTFIGTNVAGLASLTVQAGVTNTLQGFTNFTAAAVTMMSNGVMVVSNSVLTLTALAIQTNAHIYGYNSTATVNGVQYTGNFVLEQYWYLELTARPLNFTDGFEAYSLSTPLSHLGPNGWAASAASVMVVSNTVSSTTNSSAQVALIPAGAVVSNLVTGTGHTKVWTDLLFRQTDQTDLVDFINTNGPSPVVCFINTNGWLTVLTPTGWDICSNDVRNGSAPNVATGMWAEISWYMDFTPPAGKVSYFVNGHLVRQSLPFAKWATHISRLKAVADDATAWLDNVNIMTNLPAGVTNWPGSDSDHDGVPDAVEIELYGTISLCGSVYKIR